MSSRSWICFAVLVAAAMGEAREIPLTALDLSMMRQGYKSAQQNVSVTSTPLTIAGKRFATGVGTHAPSTCYVELDGKATSFEAWVGIDDGAKGIGSVEFEVLADGQVAYSSGVMRSGKVAQRVQVPLAGVKVLLLRVNDGGDDKQFDHADWADAKIITDGETPVAVENVTEPKVILTPKPGPEPRINGPSVYGGRPRNPFLYRIPTTGARPLEFTAEGLPDGLKVDGATGIIAGITPAKGDYKISILAKNAHGTASKELTIKSGDGIALTPYMGWNDWYAYYSQISDKRMREAADAIVANGMADFGYDYVCIDDCWMMKPGSEEKELAGDPRDKNGNILPNGNFPDMKKLTDYFHGKGLKAGIYSSPGPLTCGGYAGSFDFEAKDAKQIADWGFDLFKYDWCSYGKGVLKTSAYELAQQKAPYELMGPLVKKQNRDIIFNLCQYGMGNVWQWGAQVDGTSWRTAGDLGFTLDRFIEVALRNIDHRAWNEPGHWNDPDYLQIGYIGSRKDRGKLVPSPLTGNEQYSFMSLWCLMASPLMYSGDVTQMDEFTLNVLCNAEVIEVNQDPLGQCASKAELGNDCYLLVKDMADGSKAIGLLNGTETTRTLSANWSAVGVAGSQTVRDLWRQKDVGNFEGHYQTDVPRHGIAFLRLRKAE